MSNDKKQKSWPNEERRAENEASVLRRLVELMLEHQNAVMRQHTRENFWKNVRWFAVAGGFVLLAIVNMISLNKLTGIGKLPMPVDGAYAAQVRIDGMIAPGKPADAKHIVPLLEDAFDDKEAKGVLLRINSPGGTPVQAAIINRAITRLKKAHPDKKVIALAEDLMASGAYYIAVAADEIYANENSVVGSIGVKLETYGAVDLAKKLGIERRIFAAGEHKVRLDMFKPVRPEDKQKFENMLHQLHENFITAVKTGRSEKLVDDPDIFTGDFWTAKKAQALGLIDGIATPHQVLSEKFGVQKTRDYSPQPGLLTRLTQATLSGLGWSTNAESQLPLYTY